MEEAASDLLDDDRGCLRNCRILALSDSFQRTQFSTRPFCRANGRVLWFVGVVTALLTSFYMFRLWYLAFMGKPRGEDVHPHESPVSMLGQW